MLYEADKHGCDIPKYPIHFFGYGAKESFQELLICYISLNLLELTQSEQKETIEEKWLLTDEDTFQYRRRLKDGVYERYQIGERIPAYDSQNDERFGGIHTVVNISDIDIESILNIYGYDSIDELKKSYGADLERVLAEGESEMMVGYGYGYISQCEMTWKEAAAMIIKLIGLNFREKGICTVKTKAFVSQVLNDSRNEALRRPDCCGKPCLQ